uniref:Uncharacterized protein n=1 Tax=Rousettus aegyptiacus TaxID=9407 RepID=A0A7J8BSU0_ROUAE|nr:hypothetical protein HJG63_009592 [Rousettus aegyptiacus]
MASLISWLLLSSPAGSLSPWKLESDSSFLSPEPSMAPTSLSVKAKVFPLATRPCWSCCSCFLLHLSRLRPPKLLRQVRHSLAPGPLHKLRLHLRPVSPRCPDVSPNSFRCQIKCHTHPCPFFLSCHQCSQQCQINVFKVITLIIRVTY